MANIGILLLDHTGNAALTRTGNGGIFVTNGDIVIDSSNKQAGLITGKGNVMANDIFVTVIGCAAARDGERARLGHAMRKSAMF